LFFFRHSSGERDHEIPFKLYLALLVSSSTIALFLTKV
jgi:hypothetical protein